MAQADVILLSCERVDSGKTRPKLNLTVEQQELLRSSLCSLRCFPYDEWNSPSTCTTENSTKLHPTKSFSLSGSIRLVPCRKLHINANKPFDHLITVRADCQACERHTKIASSRLQVGSGRPAVLPILPMCTRQLKLDEPLLSKSGGFAATVISLISCGTLIVFWAELLSYIAAVDSRIPYWELFFVKWFLYRLV